MYKVYSELTHSHILVNKEWIELVEETEEGFLAIWLHNMADPVIVDFSGGIEAFHLLINMEENS